MTDYFEIKSFLTLAGPRLEYKGFIDTAEIDLDNNLLHGRVISLVGENDTLTKFTHLCDYEGNTVIELKEDFKQAINSYLDDMQF